MPLAFSPEIIDAVIAGRHSDIFAVLGPHATSDTGAGDQVRRAL